MHFHNVIERISEHLANEYIHRKCDNCGKVTKTMDKATNNKMLELFEKFGFEKDIYKKCRRIRGKIAHGSGERNNKLYTEIFTILPKIETVALKLIKEVTSLTVIESELLTRFKNHFMEVTAIKKYESNGKINTSFKILDLKYHFDFNTNEIGDVKEVKDEFITDHLPAELSEENFDHLPYPWPY